MKVSWKALLASVATLGMFACGGTEKSPARTSVAPQIETITVTMTAQVVETDEDTPVNLAFTIRKNGARAANATVELTDAPQHGAATTEGTVLTYTPETNYNGSDSLSVTTRLDGEAEETLQVSIHVRPVNDAPVAHDVSYVLNEDELLSVPVPGVLSSTTDVENDVLVAYLVSPPLHGELIFGVEGSFSYVPDLNFNGTDSFAYRSDDGHDRSEVAVATLEIVPVNDPPSIASVLLAGGSATGVTATASATGWYDVEGALPVLLYRWTVNGSTVPVSGATLPDSYIRKGNLLQAFVTPWDGAVAGAEVASQTITVANTAPQAVATTVTLYAGETTTFSILATDIDGDSLVTTATLAPLRGRFSSGMTNGTYTYTPVEGFAGTDHFQYKVSDGTAWSDAATVDITVLRRTLSAQPYDGTPGPLPAFACTLPAAFAIESISPATSTTLQTDGTYNFTATVSYAVTTTDTIHLSALNDTFDRYQAAATEEVTVQPSGGCATATLAISGVPMNGSKSLFIAVESANSGWIRGSGVMFFTADGPRFRIVAMSPSIDQPLVPDENGDVAIEMEIEWSNVPADWVSLPQLWMGSAWAFASHPPGITSGRAVVPLTIRAPSCNADTVTVAAGGGNDTYEEWNYVQYFADMPDTLIRPSTGWVQTATSGFLTRNLNVLNCSAEKEYFAAQTAPAWVYPQAGSTSVAAGASGVITVATNASLLAIGDHQGTLDVATTGLGTVSPALELSVADDIVYTAVPVTPDWVDKAITEGTRVSQPGDFWADYEVVLPFSVKLYGVTFDTVVINTSGVVRFGAEAPSVYASFPGTYADFSIVANYRYGQVYTDGGIYAFSDGVAPNRRFIVTYDRIGFLGNTADIASTQFIFTEGSDAFVVHTDATHPADFSGLNLGDGITGLQLDPNLGSSFSITPN